jgi:HEAT repeat protein/beta-lactamase regulating signal transducer with metallopeptidase domain
MNQIMHYLLQPAPAASVLAALIDLSLKATLIFVVAGVAASMTRRRPASVRHAIWLAAVAGVLVLPLIAGALPSWRVLPFQTAQFSPVIPARAVEAIPDAASGEVRPVQETAESGAGSPGQTGASASVSPEAPLLGEARSPELTPTGPSQNAVITGINGIRTQLEATPWSVLLLGTWLLGILAVLGHNIVGALGLFMVSRRAKRVTSREWLDLAEEIGDRLWITRDVQLLKSHVTTMPVTWGGRKPVVLLPSDADSWSDEQRRHVLTHEFAHIRRWDCTTQGLAQLACAIYWFNPLLWVASRRLRVERERACDDQVILTGGRPSSYAQHLLQIASSLRATLASPLGAVAMARPSQLEGRVLSILDPDRRRMSFKKSNTGVVFGLATLLILPISAMAPVGAPTEAPLETRDAAMTEASPQAAESPVLDARSTVFSDSPELSGASSPRPATKTLTSPPAWTRTRPVLPDTIDIRKKKVVDAFIVALEDPEEDIRMQAAQMLGELEDERSIPALRDVAGRDESPDVRRAALWALSEMDDDEVLPVLVSIAGTEKDPDARRQIAWMIGEIADNEDDAAGEALMDMLTDENTEVRATAVWALAEMEYSPALSSVVTLVDDPDQEVRKRATWAISEIVDDAPPEEAVRALVRAMGSDDAEVRAMAVYALGDMETPAAVPGLIQALGDPEVEVRQRAAWALGEIGSAAAIDALREAMQDEDRDVRKAAARALGSIDWDEVDSQDDAPDSPQDEHGDSGDWDLSVSMDHNTFQELGSMVGNLVGDVTGVALSSASNAVAEMDLEGIAQNIGYALDEIDLDVFADEIAAGLQDLDEDIRVEVGTGIAVALAGVVREHPNSGQARAARRALRRMNHPRAELELRRLDGR